MSSAIYFQTLAIIGSINIHYAYIFISIFHSQISAERHLIILIITILLIVDLLRFELIITDSNSVVLPITPQVNDLSIQPRKILMDALWEIASFVLGICVVDTTFLNEYLRTIAHDFPSTTGNIFSHLYPARLRYNYQLLRRQPLMFFYLTQYMLQVCLYLLCGG